jgi:hypothetical protein
VDIAERNQLLSSYAACSCQYVFDEKNDLDFFYYYVKEKEM